MTLDPQRVDFKVATLVHRSLSGISPSYLAVSDDYVPQRTSLP